MKQCFIRVSFISIMGFVEARLPLSLVKPFAFCKTKKNGCGPVKFLLDSLFLRERSRLLILYDVKMNSVEKPNL